MPTPEAKKERILLQPENEDAIHALEQMLVELGMESTTRADLCLSSAEIDQLTHVKKQSDILFYIGKRSDGLPVRVMICPAGRGNYAAEIFSPTFYKNNKHIHILCLNTSLSK